MWGSVLNVGGGEDKLGKSMGVWEKVRGDMGCVKKRGGGVGERMESVECGGCGKVCWGVGGGEEKCRERHEGVGKGKGNVGGVKKCGGGVGECMG